MQTPPFGTQSLPGTQKEMSLLRSVLSASLVVSRVIWTAYTSVPITNTQKASIKELKITCSQGSNPAETAHPRPLDLLWLHRFNTHHNNANIEVLHQFVTMINTNQKKASCGNVVRMREKIITQNLWDSYSGDKKGYSSQEPRWGAYQWKPQTWGWL